MPKTSSKAGSGDAAAKPASDPNFMSSLARGLMVIQAFSEQRRSLSISQISQKTGIPRAAARRCIYTLGQLGFVRSEDGRQFLLHPRVLSLGHAYLASTPLGTASMPILRRVSTAINEATSISILDGDMVLYIANVSAARLMTINLDVGTRLPAYCTSPGRAMVSQFGEAELAAFLSRTNFVKYTSTTLTTSTALRNELLLVRRQGYSIVDQELEVGLRTMAVPIFDRSGKSVAAMGVGAHAARISMQDMTQRFLPILQEAAAELTL